MVETMLRKEERSRIRAVQMDNPNPRKMELWGATKGGVDERMSDSILRCFGHVERVTGLQKGLCMGVRS